MLETIGSRSLASRSALVRVTLVAAAVVIVGAGCGEDTELFPSSSSGGASGPGASGSGAAGGSGAEGGGGPGSGAGPASSGPGPGSGGATQGGAGPGGAATCNSLGDECTTCLHASCNELYCDCLGSPCIALVLCLQPCAPGDDACSQPCFEQHQNGISDAALLGNCGATSCVAECPAADPLSECQVCLFESCKPAMNHCLANPDCFALLDCLVQCGTTDPGCQTLCSSFYPGGVDDATQVQMCSNQKCSGACG